MRKYENQVQMIKSIVLTQVAKYAFEGTLNENIARIPTLVDPGPEERYRCCIFHERAITADRIKMAIGGTKSLPGIIEVLESACDQCPVDRYVVTETCRGCLAHRCIGACPVDAISTVKGRAVIDYERCIECGKCKENCPYNAIADVMRPCKRECPTNAIQIDHRKKAVIDYDRCISCGACVYNCPFGAIQEKSEILPVINALCAGKQSVYAIVAPAFATQFNYVPLGNVIAGIKKLGFKDVIEVALGADLVTPHEAEELLHMKAIGQTMTSSCCPSFVEFMHKSYPELTKHISKTVSPMIATARLIKHFDPDSIVVFIGPCIAKKVEKQKTTDTDFVLTFEELAALIDAKGIQLETLEPLPLDNASYYGRKFAATGGLTASVQNHLNDLTTEPLTYEICDGINACDKALKLLKFNRLKADFIEGMVCSGGCIKGPVTMHHGLRDIKAIEAYAKLSMEPTPRQAIRIFEDQSIRMT